MTRIPLATILAALVFAPLLTADDAKSGEVKSKRADAAKEFAAFTKKAQEFQTKMANATPEERKDLLKDRPNPQPLLEKAQKMIDDDGTDDAAVDALVLLAQFSPQFGAKHFELLTEHHATSSKSGRVCMRAMARDGLSPEGEKFITTVLAKNKNKEPLAFANFMMAQVKLQLDKDEDALPYLQKIEKYYGDVELGRGRDGKPVTMGRVVGGSIFAIRNLAKGKTIPDVTSQDLAGKKVELKDLRGKVVVLDFWATWCRPCVAMIPHTTKLVEKLKDKPFIMVSISSDEKKETLTEFLEKKEMPWTHWWEGSGDTSLHSKWGVQSIPTLYVVDSKGVIRHKQVGLDPQKMEDFEKIIEDLVKEAEEKK